MIHVTFENPNGSTIDVEAMPGMSLMEAALMGMVPDILGLCGGICSCATCHVILPQPQAGRIPQAGAEERAMLDSLETAAPTSRLGCQVKLGPELDHVRVRVVSDTSGQV